MICGECRKSLAYPRSVGCHTARTCQCDYCNQVKICLPDRHYIFKQDLKERGFQPVAIKKIGLSIEQKDFVHLSEGKGNKILVHHENGYQEIDIWGRTLNMPKKESEKI